MPSLRKRVTSYFRQLSFHNEPREKRNNFIENSFINKYLNGEVRLKESPPIIYGKNPTDLPNYEINLYKTGSKSIVACYTGPHGGLTSVKRKEKHLSVQDEDDIDFIDTQDEEVVDTQKVIDKQIPKTSKDLPLDNTTMVIKVAGQEYLVTNRKRSHSKSHSLGSLADFNKIEIDKTKKIINNINNNDQIDTNHCDSKCDNSNDKKCVKLDVGDKVETDINDTQLEQHEQQAHALTKSKSEGNPFGHKKHGKITRLQHRPTGGDSNVSHSANTRTDPSNPNLPQEWNMKSDFAYGISDSLYDKNLITKAKNGDPIADCFGIIARNDSAILAVADGVNWGEKAAIAAKSAIHGCLHYLNKTIFLDTKPFDNLVAANEESGAIKMETTMHETRITNTREIFVCLLRAFNCAHDLILENNGMLTTLTVAIILPLKQQTVRHSDDGEVKAPTDVIENYICCVCNVGDTLAYVYSHKYGIRELTKGSHDINCNRDMRDALGALGPVDGIKPELSNLTLSITRIHKGDIVMVASDGLTDNFDPNVCKFTVNCEMDQAFRKHHHHEQSTTTKSKPPIKPPRKNLSNRSSRSSNDSTTTTAQQQQHDSSIRSRHRSVQPSTSSSSKQQSGEQQRSETTNKNENPLVAQFLRENSLDSDHDVSKHLATAASQPKATSSHKPIMHKQMKSASAKNIHNTRERERQREQKPVGYSILRSKTALDFRHQAKAIERNTDGLPYITPLQRYELTLLLIEDILKRGISGKEGECAQARKLCENLVRFTMSITNAKRRTLEDTDLYYNNRNGVLVEITSNERKSRRKQALEKVQNLPGKLDHVTVVAYNVGNVAIHR